MLKGKKITIIVLILALLFLLNLFGFSGIPLWQKPEYCLLITVDALDRDYIQESVVPNIFQWEKEGVIFPDVINVYPTITTPNMTSLVTGAYPITTTIGANLVYLKEEKKAVGAPRFNRAVTIGEVFQKSGLNTAVVQHFMLENRGADVYRQIPGGDTNSITSASLEILQKKPTPRLLAVLYQEVDVWGHNYGAQSKEILQKVAQTDGEIARLIKAYKDLGILEKTLVIISSDHGMSHKEKQIEVEKLEEKIKANGWKFQRITEKSILDPNVDFYWIQAGNMQCYFNRTFSQEERERLFAVIRSVEGIGTIFNQTMLRRFHCHPNAGDFIVEPAPGYWFGGAMGVHGRNTESDAFLLMFGPGLKKGTKVYGAETVDIVPTVLHLMGLKIPESVDGKILWDAIEK